VNERHARAQNRCRQDPRSGSLSTRRTLAGSQNEGFLARRSHNLPMHRPPELVHKSDVSKPLHREWPRTRGYLNLQPIAAGGGLPAERGEPFLAYWIAYRLPSVEPNRTVSPATVGEERTAPVLSIFCRPTTMSS